MRISNGLDHLRSSESTEALQLIDAAALPSRTQCEQRRDSRFRLKAAEPFDKSQRILFAEAIAAQCHKLFRELGDRQWVLLASGCVRYMNLVDGAIDFGQSHEGFVVSDIVVDDRIDPCSKTLNLRGERTRISELVNGGRPIQKCERCDMPDTVLCLEARFGIFLPSQDEGIRTYDELNFFDIRRLRPLPKSDTSVNHGMKHDSAGIWLKGDLQQFPIVAPPNVHLRQVGLGCKHSGEPLGRL